LTAWLDGVIGARVDECRTTVVWSGEVEILLQKVSPIPSDHVSIIVSNTIFNHGLEHDY
jgi:hypothetical protein